MNMNIKVKLQPKQKVFRKAIEKYPVVGYGGSRGSGKSQGLRSIHLIRRIEYPGSVGAIFRETYPELRDNHIEPLLRDYPGLRPYYNDSKKIIKFPNGSIQQFCHCKSMKDVNLYQGREFHDFAFEEAGNITEDIFQALRASNRSSNPNIPARSQVTGNPGGIGHQWIKRLFISKRYKEHERPNDYFWIQAYLTDNPALMKANPEYRNTLLSQTSGALRRAWLEGDWDIEAGQFFDDLNRSVHLIEPFKIPIHWRYFLSYDYGYNHPASWLFWATDEDGNCYLIKTITQAKMGIAEQANKVIEYDQFLLDTKQKQKSGGIVWAGHDIWAKKKADDPTIAEDLSKAFGKHNFVMARANIERKLGASQVRMYLSYKTLEDGKRDGPRTFIFNTEEIVFDCLSRMVHNPNDAEDVLKVDAIEGDTETGDDLYDAFRYGLMSRPLKTIPLRIRRGTTYDSVEPERPSWQTI